MRNATDKELKTTEKVLSINSISLTEKYLAIDINTRHISGHEYEDDNKKLCLDRIAFTPSAQENIVPIHSPTFICPQDIKSQAQEKLAKDSHQSLVVRFQNKEESYRLKEDTFHSRKPPILLSLRDGFKSTKIVKGNKLYYALMPFTFVFDIITAPIQWGIYFYEVRKTNMKLKKKKQ